MKFLLLAFMFCGFGCSVEAMSPKKEKVKITAPSTPAIPSGASVESIASNSSCAKYCFKWGNKGKCGPAPKNLLRGLAMSYARGLCAARADVVIASQPIGSVETDALAHYKVKVFSSPEKIRQTLWGLMVGAAMRESSGKYCAGVDKADNNTNGYDTEAGLFQTSYDSQTKRTANPELALMFASFKASQKGCYKEIYSNNGAVTCSSADWKNYGSGEGLAFQKLTKECPGFAAEYASVMFRTQRRHYGPLNRKSAELAPQCVDMFAQVEKLVISDSSICSKILND